MARVENILKFGERQNNFEANGGPKMDIIANILMICTIVQIDLIIKMLLIFLGKGYNTMDLHARSHAHCNMRILFMKFYMLILIGIGKSY